MASPPTRFINKCNVAVVGGAGFLGSHMVNHLLFQRECRVLVIDNLVSGRREFVPPQATFVHADITLSESYLLRLFHQYRIEYVFNYAACPYIPVSFDRPSYVVNVNLTGAMNVINAAQEAGCGGILQISSAEIYGEGSSRKQFVMGEKLNENAEVIPHSTYGASKAAVDFYVQSRWKEASTPCIALRQFNCVGENETHPYVIPEIFCQLYRSLDGVVYLGNNSNRDFLYAGDAVAMAVELLEKGLFGEVYNLGYEKSISIHALAELIGKVIGLGKVTVRQDPSRIRPWEIWNLCSDNSKVYSVIDRRPEVTLEEALHKVNADFNNQNRRWSWE